MRTRAIKFLVISLFGLLPIFLFVGQVQPGGDPAPSEDRVGFPEGYRDNYKILYVFDRPDNRQVRVIYGNDLAASVKADEPFSYGSILVMETYRAKLDEQDQVLLDAQGRFQRDELTGIFVSRKEKGFGEAYQQNRTGEWEYVAYRPDRTYLTPPQQSAPCARCHLLAGSGRDWMFRMSLFFNRASGALPNGLMQHYLFVPNVIQTRPGGTVTWYNDDEVEHRIVLTGGGFDSGNMRQGASASHTFKQAGTYDYQCQIHPAMKGTVLVQDDK